MDIVSINLWNLALEHVHLTNNRSQGHGKARNCDLGAVQFLPIDYH